MKTRVHREGLSIEIHYLSIRFWLHGSRDLFIQRST